MPSVDDLATLDTLDENGLQEEIKRRFNADLIYTYIGDILIALNPYKQLAIYDQQHQLDYHGLQTRSEKPPHIFAVSDNVYQSLVHTSQNQICVVSGESGAGKTESTKYMVQHIAKLCQHDSSDLHERIVQVNPLLEAFGNAQTVINNNSSRFGKFIELGFETDGNINGAHISEYLLEKSRVVSQAHGERNFHIFYYLFCGLSPELLQCNRLSTPDEHRILRPVDGSAVFKTSEEKIASKRMWENLQHLFQVTGFKEEQVDSIMATLAAILHLTDIEFKEDDESCTDGVLVKNETSLEMAAQLLLVKPEDLVSALVSNVTVLKGSNERILSVKNMTQANDGRDALAKALFGRMFGWTVRQVNFLLKPDQRRRVMSKNIGILDLAGFENFQNNSFEQLCINVANEQLHFYFNQHIFQWEMEEYKKEGIEGKDIKFVDNKALLELFITPIKGLFSVLDDHLRVPGATDRTFIDKITSDFVQNPHFRRPKGNTLNFVITHYAGQVVYDCDNFLEKNRDTLSINLLDCMKNSESLFVTELFYAPISNRGSMIVKFDAPSRNRMSVLLSKKPKLLTTSKPGAGSRLSRTASNLARSNKAYTTFGTVGRRGQADGTTTTMASHFMNSLTHLMGKLNAGEPHFIRCIKPNCHKMPDVFQDDLVLQQLRYTGVLETVKIRRQGYATRLPFETFFNRYKILCFPLSENNHADADNCQKILIKIGLKDYEIGKSKVFLRYWHTEQLQLPLEQAMRSILKCQSTVRAFIARTKVRRMKEVARQQALVIRSVCDEIARVSEELYRMQIEHFEFDIKENERKRNEAREKAEKERIEKEKMEKERIEKERTDIERMERERMERERLENAQKREKSQQEEKDRIEKARLEREFEEAKEREKLQSPMRKEVKSLATTDVPVVPVPVVPPPPSILLSQSKQFLWELLQDASEKYTQLSSQIWAKVFYMEKGELVGKVYLRDWDVIINSSDVKYDGKVIGLNYEQFDNPLRDQDTQQVLDHIGEGVEIARDEEGNILVRNLSDYPIIAKDYTNPASTCLSPDVVDAFGQIPKWPVKIFDMNKYKYHIAQELQKPDINVSHLQMLSIVSFAFGKNSLNDYATPSWIFIINFACFEMLGDETVLQELLRMGQVAVSSSRQTRIKRDWADLYRPRRQSDSMRSSTVSEVDYTTGSVGYDLSISRKDQSADDVRTPMTQLPTKQNTTKDKKFLTLGFGKKHKK